MPTYSSKISESITYPLIVTNKAKNINNNNDNNQKKAKIKQKRKLSFKKSNSLNFLTNPNDISKTKKIEIINSINLSKNNNIRTNSKNNSYAMDLFFKHRAIDNESLQVKNRQLKTEINEIKKKLNNINMKNTKNDKEIVKQEALLDQLLNINQEAYLNTLSSLDKNISINAKDSNNIYLDNIILKLNRQYQELLNDNKEKEKEIKVLKKDIKNSKMNELNIENKILITQYNKYKNLYNHIVEENKNYFRKMKNQNDLENEIFQKNMEILQLQENLKFRSAMNIQYEKEAEDLRNKIK